MRDGIKILAELETSQLSIREFCRVKQIDPTQLRRWKNSVNIILNLRMNRISIHAGRKPEFAELENALLNYVLSRRSNKYIVTVRNLTNYLYSILPLEKHKIFPNMRRYIYRFMARNRLSIRRITRNISLTDNELEIRANGFLNTIQNIVINNSSIIFVNMDETAIYCEELIQKTIECIGSRSVIVRTNKVSSDRITSALAVASNGGKLTPMVIFKGEENGRIARTIKNSNSRYPNSVFYAV